MLMNEYIDNYLNESLIAAEKQLELKDVFLNIANLVSEKVDSGGTVFFCGNGGSAADSQHLAAELIGRFKKNRKPIKSIALTTDSSVITSTGNDLSFDEIFVRQLEALAQKDDVLIGISTSGESANVIKAIEYANKIKMLTVVFTNEEENTLSKLSELVLKAPSKETGVVQQSHITFGQLLCYYLEENIKE
jgi:D-sedoheptulose 7-phosphate isomerase|tara:strand:+ start:2686 stop:3258 length:573 start_codon:yes stop_codon:yes gene_type:complete